MSESRLVSMRATPLSLLFINPKSCISGRIRSTLILETSYLNLKTTFADGLGYLPRFSFSKVNMRLPEPTSYGVQLAESDMCGRPTTTRGTYMVIRGLICICRQLTITSL